MSDVGLFIVEKNPGRHVFDIKVGDYDLLPDDGAETATFISLFTNQRVTNEEKPFFSNTKYGWWGDLLSEIEGDQIGSKLWTLEREKTTTETQEKFINYTEECLQWMIDDGFTDQIEVDASFISRGVIELSIDIYRPDITEGIFKIIWDGQEIRRA